MGEVGELSLNRQVGRARGHPVREDQVRPFQTATGWAGSGIHPGRLPRVMLGNSFNTMVQRGWEAHGGLGPQETICGHQSGSAANLAPTYRSHLPAH